ncbi:MAG: hypothetical protein OES23_06345, partial [Nitrosopumilus sp.]|nr:hypothetical protein [Nitrosopumilus sp.]
CEILFVNKSSFYIYEVHKNMSTSSMKSIDETDFNSIFELSLIIKTSFLIEKQNHKKIISI